MATYQEPKNTQRQADNPLHYVINPGSSDVEVPKAYQGLLDANPYRNVDYQKSGWQNFLSALGIRSGFDKRAEDLQLQAAEYDAQVLEKAHNEQYDSAAANAQRMRQAGLNPDLLGADNGGSSSAMREDTNPPADIQSDYEQVQTFAGTIMSAVTTAFGLAKEVGTLRSLKLANDAKDISNVEGIMTTALNAVLNHVPSKAPNNNDEWGQIINDTADRIKLSYEGTMPKRVYKRFNREVNNFLTSAPAEYQMYENWTKGLKTSRDMAIANSSQYTNDADLEVLHEIVKPLAELNDKVLKGELDVKAKDLENKETYLNKADSMNLPEMTAETESSDMNARQAENENTSQNARMQKELRSTLSKIIHNLETKAQSGKRGSGFAETVLLMMSLMSMMNMSVSPGEKTPLKVGF